MDPTTQEYLRKAAIDALSAKADAAALELLAMLHGQTQCKPEPAPTRLLEPAPYPGCCDAHDIYYWERSIRELFIPFMTGNGRLKFTSPEMLAWLENCSEVTLTKGDLELYSDGKIIWRDRASSGLNSLKKQGIVYAPPFGKNYEIQKARLQEAF